MLPYILALFSGCLWTLFLTLEKHFIAQRQPFAAALNTFMIAVLSISILKHYSHSSDPLELVVYALGCATTTYTVLVLLPGRKHPTKKPPSV